MSSATPTILFGQVVIGSPGAGKTTYCEAMARFLKALGRDVAIVNIDPANENMPYEADIGKKNIQKHHWLFFREMDLKIGSFMINTCSDGSSVTSNNYFTLFLLFRYCRID